MNNITNEKRTSTEAEQYIIACALVDDTKTAELLEISEDWFQQNAHKLIIRTIRELASNNLPVDSFSIGDHLTRSNQINMIGGMPYLVELEESLPSLSMWNSYKNSLFNYYKMSQIEKLSSNLKLQLENAMARPEDIIEGLQANLIDLLTDHHSGGFKKVGDYLDEVITELEWRDQNKGQLLGQKTGFNELDFTLDGLQDGKIYVIAGRPGSGKTAFGLAICDGLTETQKPWFYFSLEMTGKSLAKRMLVRQSGVSNNKFRGGMNETDYQKVGAGMGAVQDRTLHVDQTPSLSIAQIRSRLKASQVRHGSIGGVVIDHIGLIKKDARKSDTEAMNIIADDLLRLAKEFDCPMVELCQLNRGVEGRAEKRPMISDLKQSGKIEENADVVMLLYRDDYYDKDAEPVTEVDVAKNRDGETKPHFFKHDMSIGKYEALSDFVRPEQTKRKF